MLVSQCAISVWISSDYLLGYSERSLTADWEEGGINFPRNQFERRTRWENRNHLRESAIIFWMNNQNMAETVSDQKNHWCMESIRTKEFPGIRRSVFAPQVELWFYFEIALRSELSWMSWCDAFDFDPAHFSDQKLARLAQSWYLPGWPACARPWVAQNLMDRHDTKAFRSYDFDQIRPFFIRSSPPPW